MKRSILALASGAFILGAAEFVMMGILPQTATAMHVSIPAAGHYISAYAIGVCVGTLILVFGRKVPPKHLIILFTAIALVGNTLSAVSFCSPMLLVARFISGLPHGAFFGTATLIAKTLADKGKEAQSVSMMVMGQTVANMLGVPAGTLLAEAMSWRLAFAILAAWALMTIVVVISWVPSIDPIKDAGIKGQFRFLTHPGPWLILLAVFFGNSGIFCWWSYVSPWLQKTGGWSATMVPMLMVLAGLGMVVGGIVGGRLTDLWKAGATAALSHGIALCGLLLVFLLPGNHATTALLTFIIGFALFFNSSPQQLLMVQAGDGDELPFHRHRRRADQPARRHPAGALHPSLRSPRLAPSQPSHPSPPNPISASIPSPPIRETDAEDGLSVGLAEIAISNRRLEDAQRRFGGKVRRNRRVSTYPQVDCGGDYCDFPLISYCFTAQEH